MATSSYSLSTSSLSKLTFLTPRTTLTTHKLRFSLSKLNQHRRLSLRTRIRVSSREETVVQEREVELVNGIELNGNSNGNYNYNGSVDKYANGNGSLMEYGNGNGKIGGEVVVEKKGEEVVKKKQKKKSVEEIGQEDAWFKRNGGQVEV